MDTPSIANSLLLLVGIVSLAIAIRAFIAYRSSSNDMIFILGLAMASTALGIFCAYAGNIHLGGIQFNTHWAWYAGTTSGALFLFLSSLVQSMEQLRLLRRWQVIATTLVLLVVILTPVLPAFSSPMIPAILNLVRTTLYVGCCVRYASLYLSKETRFSLFMGLGFLALAVGFGMVTPQILQPDFAILAILGAVVRAAGYTALLAAYTFA
jgi:hypothetical protein